MVGTSNICTNNVYLRDHLWKIDSKVKMTTRRGNMNEVTRLDDIEKVKIAISNNKDKWIKLIKDSREILINMEIKDRLNGIKAYLKSKRNCEQAKSDLFEVEEWNKKKIGEHLLELKEEGELDKGGDAKTRLSKNSIGVKLTDLSLSPDESSSFQRRALIEDDKFEDILDRCVKKGDIGKTAIDKKVKKLKDKEKLDKKVEEGSKKFIKDDKFEIINKDFRKAKIDQNSVDLILTDPPYPEKDLPLWRDLAVFAERVLKPSKFLICYSGEMFLPEVFNMLTAKLKYYWTFSLILSGNKQLISARNIFCGWKPILIFQKPPFKKIEIPIEDIIKGTGREKEYHKWEQAMDEMKPIIEAFTLPGELIVDPFAGSGSIGLVAYKLDRQSINIEKEKNDSEKIKERFYKLKTRLKED
ncbi:hypothetical protein ES705_39464 [subsurface metagenome]